MEEETTVAIPVKLGVSDEIPASSEKRAQDVDEEPIQTKRQKLEIPDGMSKNQWKKLQKQKRWEESKEEYRKKKREKKKAANERRKEKIREMGENGEKDEDVNYHQLKKAKKLPEQQIKTGVKILMDCEFDDLMNDKEIVSLSNQIARSYSAMRHSDYDVKLSISSFNKNLKKRFDKSVSQYTKWNNIEFTENEKLSDILPSDPEMLSKYIYLTADTEEEIQSLEEGYTYIIGGIVDKNRYKKLCLNKAKDLGLKVARLPIGKYIQVNGRHVLATSHVYELACKWFENGHDWESAFNEVLPPRKIKGKLTKDQSPESKSSDADDEESANVTPAA